jgi:hypothetical protein
LILTTVTHQVETNLLNASNIGACLTKPLKQSKLPDYLQAALSENAGPLAQEIARRHPDSHKPILLLMDGQKSLWEAGQRDLPPDDMVEILDL